MIFTHGIIPHNHIEDNINGRNGYMHSSLHYHNSCNLTKEFNSQCEDVSVCHISNFLFHQFNQDNLIIQTDKDNIGSVLLTGQIFFDKDQSFITDNFFGFLSLRAPPLT